MLPYDQLMTALRHYAACEFRDPEHTSACIIVPTFCGVQYRHMLDRFKKRPQISLWITYPYTGRSACQILRTLLVYYDPRVKALCMSLRAVLGHLKEGSGHFVLFKARVAANQVNVLLDSRATYSFIDEGFLKSVKQALHTVTSGAPFTVKTAGRQSMAINRQCNLAISLAHALSMHVASWLPCQMVNHIILGEDLLVPMKADLNFETKTATLNRGTRTYRLSSQQDKISFNAAGHKRRVSPHACVLHA